MDEARDPCGIKLVVFYAVCLVVSAALYMASQAWSAGDPAPERVETEQRASEG